MSDHGIEPEAIARAQKYDPQLDVQALIRNLVSRRTWDSVGNKTAYFVGAAKRCQREGEYRRGGREDAVTRGPTLNDDGSPAVRTAAGIARAQAAAREIADLMRQAAHGESPEVLGSGVDAIILSGTTSVDLRFLRQALVEHGVGWTVERVDEDIPF